jgi:DNA-binding transcriptional LysR family regulator
VELRHLRYFVAVAEAEHVGRAARRLRVAQQSLSAQVRDLERELGIRLFVRHPRGMALTRAGEEFLDYARRALAEHARAVEHVRRVGRHDTRLRVELLRLAPAHHALFRRAVAAFRAQYPHARLELVPTAYLADRATLRDGRLDVGFYPGLPVRDPGVTCERLWVDPIVGALLPADHPLATAPELTPADLSALPLVSIPQTLQPAEVDRELAGLRAHGWRGHLEIELSDASVVLDMVAYGAAWLHAPRSLAGAPAPGTTYRPFPAGYPSPAPFDLQAVTRAGDPDPLAAAFLACVREARDDMAAGPPAPAGA